MSQSILSRHISANRCRNGGGNIKMDPVLYIVIEMKGAVFIWQKPREQEDRCNYLITQVECNFAVGWAG